MAQESIVMFSILNANETIGHCTWRTHATDTWKDLIVTRSENSTEGIAYLPNAQPNSNAKLQRYTHHQMYYWGAEWSAPGAWIWRSMLKHLGRAIGEYEVDDDGFEEGIQYIVVKTSGFPM